VLIDPDGLLDGTSMTASSNGSISSEGRRLRVDEVVAWGSSELEVPFSELSVLPDDAKLLNEDVVDDREPRRTRTSKIGLRVSLLCSPFGFSTLPICFGTDSPCWGDGTCQEGMFELGIHA
jgi:hypothetical protein